MPLNVSEVSHHKSICQLGDGPIDEEWTELLYVYANKSGCGVLRKRCAKE